MRRVVWFETRPIKKKKFLKNTQVKCRFRVDLQYRYGREVVEVITEQVTRISM